MIGDCGPENTTIKSKLSDLRNSFILAIAYFNDYRKYNGRTNLPSYAPASTPNTLNLYDLDQSRKGYYTNVDKINNWINVHSNYKRFSMLISKDDLNYKF
jgi:hypothetical protein